MSILDNIKGDGKLQREKELSVKKDLALESRVDAIKWAYESWIKDIESFPCYKMYYTQDRLRDFTNTRKLSHKKLKNLPVEQNVIDNICIWLSSQNEREPYGLSGFFLSAMIQSAYNQSHNDFHIDMNVLDKEIHNLGSYISGEKRDPIEITIRGYGSFNCGTNARHSRFIFLDDAGHCCGANAKHSCFTFNRTVSGYNCGYRAKHSHFTFMDGIGDWCGSEASWSAFYSSDKERLREIKKGARLSCSFYLLEPGGTSKLCGPVTNFKHHILNWRSRWGS